MALILISPEWVIVYNYTFPEEDGLHKLPTDQYIHTTYFWARIDFCNWQNTARIMLFDNGQMLSWFQPWKSAQVQNAQQLLISKKFKLWKSLSLHILLSS